MPCESALSAINRRPSGLGLRGFLAQFHRESADTSDIARSTKHKQFQDVMLRCRLEALRIDHQTAKRQHKSASSIEAEMRQINHHILRGK